MSANKFRIGLFLLLLKQLSLQAQVMPEFLLKGTIVGLPNGSQVVLTKNKDTLARGISTGDQFELKGHIEGGANYYFLEVYPSISKAKSEALWLENQQMNVQGNITNWPKVTLEGSLSHREYKGMVDVFQTARKNGNETEAAKKYISEHLNSLYISDIIIKIAHFYRQGELDTLYAMLSPDAQNSHYGKLLSKKIAAAKTMAEMAKSNSLPNLKLTDINGKVKNLHELTSGAKYTLIDFWASWCSPCRATVPELKDIYQEYKSHGFNILGISIDKDESKWKKAVLEDETPWTQCVDNIESLVKDHLGFDAIPAFILLDSTGNIVRAHYVPNSNSVRIANQGKLSPPDLRLLLNELLAVKP